MSVYKIGTQLATAINAGAPTIKIGNMTPDECIIPVNIDFLATLPAPLNVFGPPGTANYVTVWKDSTAIFTGSVQNPTRSGNATGDTVSVNLLNVWDAFDRTPFLVDTVFALGSGSGKTAVVSYAAVPVETIVRQILQSWSAPTIFTVGFIALGNYTIDFSADNMMISEALKTALKYTPDAVIALDYSTVPPSVNVAVPAASGFTAYPAYANHSGTPADGSRLPKFEYTDRYDLQVLDVALQFTRAYNETTVIYNPSLATGNIVQSSSQSSQTALVGYDNTSLTPGPQRVFKTIQLSGAFNGTVHQYTPPNFSGQATLGFYLHKQGTGSPTYPNLYLLAPPGYVAQNAGVFTRPYNCNYSAKATAVSPSTAQNPLALNSNGEPVTGFAMYVIPETLTPPVEVQRASDLTGGVELWDIDLVLNFYTTDGTNLWVQTAAKVRVQYWLASSQIARTVRSDDASLETMPGGIAAALKNAASSLQCQGTCQITASDPIIPSAMQRKIVTPTGSTGIIQGIDLDLFTGTTNLTFGPPTQRTPDTWRKLYKL